MHRFLLLLSAFALVACASGPQTPAAATAPFFHIEPVRPVAELLPLALAATPPIEQGEFRPADLVELTALDPNIRSTGVAVHLSLPVVRSCPS